MNILGILASSIKTIILPPPPPPPAIDPNAANVSSLLRFNDIDGSTQIVDDTGKSWTVSGDAQISTAQSVYGGSSLLLSGTGFLLYDASDDFAYLTGDFTIEMHLWVDAFSGHLYALSHGSNRGSLHIVNGTTHYRWYNPTVGLSSPLYTTGTGPVNAQQWYHVAVVRNAGVTSLYLDGVLKSQDADTHLYDLQIVRVGRHGGSPGYNFRGHIDNFRITKGVARYTENFTPPSAPYPNILINDMVSLYNNSERGALYDISDTTTLFQDVDGLIPVTADGQSVALLLDKSGNNRHLRQATLSRRPIYRTDGIRHWLQFNGTSMYMEGFVYETSVTANGSGAFMAVAFTPETDNTLRGVMVESPATPSHNRVIVYSDTRTSPKRAVNFAPDTTDRYADLSTKTTVNETCIISLNHNGATGVVKKNNIVLTAAMVNSATHPTNTCFSIGRQDISVAGGTIYHHGRFYGAVVVGRQLTNTESYSVDRYLAEKSGITL